MDRFITLTKSIKPAYKELNAKPKIVFWLCLAVIGVVIICRHSMVLNIYQLCSSEDFNAAAVYIVNSLKWLDTIIIIPIAIIIVLLLTSRKRMDLDNARILFKQNDDNVYNSKPGIEIENLLIENDGEKEYIQNLHSKCEVEYGKKYTNNRVLIDSILTTKSSEYIITKLKIKWQYIKGDACSISTCEAIEPVTTYHVTIEIDTRDESIKEKVIDLEPALFIRPGEKFIGLGNFIIELQYVLTNVETHPCSNWDILYSIILLDNKDREHILVLNRNWRSIPAKRIMI